MKCNNYLKELDEQELKSINAGEKGSLLYWLGRIAGELVYTHQHNPGFGDALVMSFVVLSRICFSCLHSKFLNALKKIQIHAYDFTSCLDRE